jgi:D-glycero-alpha-D-manno-heptose-7-phosphate kinase
MIITQTPLRISFLGGGTDFAEFYSQEGGCVLSSAIDKYVFVVLHERFDDKIYVDYSRREIVDDVSQIQHELVREAMRITQVHKGVEITTLADVPAEGTGLGSSSSVTVGLLHALHVHRGTIKSTEELAQEACRIEIDICAKPIGKQDQYIAAYGGLQFIEFCPDGTVRVDPVPLDKEMQRELNLHLMLFFTNVTRHSASILNEQKENIPAQMETLRALKVLAMEGRTCLQKGDLDGLAKLLHRGWEQKKGLASKISNSEIDAIYSAARRAGAIGGKISGAGGGGFMLLLCPLSRQNAVRQALHGLRELPLQLERDGTKIILNYRR